MVEEIEEGLILGFFPQMLRGKTVSLSFSHSKIFVLASMAVNSLKTALRTTLHSPVPTKLLHGQTGDPIVEKENKSSKQINRK